MSTVTIDEAQARLPELVAGLARGEAIELTRDGRVVARLIGERPGAGRRPGPGLAKGMITVVSEDDEHLGTFGGYMP